MLWAVTLRLYELNVEIREMFPDIAELIYHFNSAVPPCHGCEKLRTNKNLTPTQMSAC